MLRAEVDLIEEAEGEEAMKTRKLLVMAGIPVALWVGLPGTAWAGDDWKKACPDGATYPAAKCPAPKVVKKVVTDEVVVRGVAAPRRAGTQAQGGGLPVTGGDVVGLTILGLGALGAGTLLVRRTRSSTT